MTPEEIRELYLSGQLELDDEDENDLDYVEAEDGDEDEDEEDGDDDDEDEADGDDDDDEYHDAQDGGIEFVVELQSGDDAEGDEDDEHDAARAAVQQRLITLVQNPRAGLLSQRHVLEFLRRSNLGQLLFNEDDDPVWGMPDRRMRYLDPDRFPKVPSEKGRELMNSGVFGRTDVSRLSSKKHLTRWVLDRELGLGDKTTRRVRQATMTQVSSFS